MKKKYYEVVFKGKLEAINGMLEGFLLGKDGDWEYYSSVESGIETRTFFESVKDLVSFKTGLQHFILEEKFHHALQKTIKEKGDHKFLKLKYIKEARNIKSSSFTFSASAYAGKYADEIKSIISAAPSGVTIEDYNPVEEIDESAKGVELYSPVHDYTFKCEGKAIGEFGDIINFRKKLNDHPLVHLSSIKLTF